MSCILTVGPVVLLVLVVGKFASQPESVDPGQWVSGVGCGPR